MVRTNSGSLLFASWFEVFLHKNCQVLRAAMLSSSGTCSPGSTVCKHRAARVVCTHLPLAMLRLTLQLNEPVVIVGFSTVVHGDDDRPGEESSWRPTAHHGAQNSLSVVH